MRRVDRDLFDGLSVTVSDGDRLGVVGANGTGKTTLLRIIAGVDQPDEGVVRRGRGARVGFLDQVPSLPPGTVRAAVGEGWEADAALDRLGMGPAADTDVSTLSGGQAKRVALARVLARPAELLVLDEPTNHLDLGAVNSTAATPTCMRAATPTTWRPRPSGTSGPPPWSPPVGTWPAGSWPGSVAARRPGRASRWPGSRRPSG